MKELNYGVIKGYIDKYSEADESLMPRIVVNDSKKSTKVLDVIESELLKCEEFYFSVAFITESGVICLINSLSNLERRNIKGVIIASQYQNFTSPKALRMLLKYKNIELRIVNESNSNMHTKGYIFKKKDLYSFIIGSSNITQNALGSNMEWNIKIDSTENGSIAEEILQEFGNVYDRSIEVDEEYICKYEKIYEESKKINGIIDDKYGEEINKIHKFGIVPNLMQKEALEKIELSRKQGNKRALIISATGTGKTYLSAFDVQKFKPKRFLFVVHRETIARAALSSYKRILGTDLTMSILSGNSKNLDANFIFSTIQTISKKEIYEQFDKNYFDYIVVDEVHRAGAESYRNIFNYFEPKFLLGMSATPERNDDFDIYKLFDYNVPYEIRLSSAMESNLICPFHYFGVSEIEVDGKIIDDETEFRFLTSDERIKNIIDKINFYGYSGDRVRGLIFCSRKEEARELSSKFNLLGYKTVALTGEDSNEKREEAMMELESTERKLDYIFTVDIFNEGVDIPSINQVIMLRPTQSAIIFVQQLGRGLRHAKNKEYVNIIDFIGNYKQNYLIPIALSGDNSYNKDNIRKFISEGSKVIPGASTISFDEITKERIFKNIDIVKFNVIKIIQDSYFQLKQRLGKIPSLVDFENNGSIQVLKIFSKCGSYHNFLKKYDTDYKIKFSEIEESYLSYISLKLADGKKPHELEIMKLLINNLGDVLEEYRKIMINKYGIELNVNSLDCSKNLLLGEYFVGQEKNKYKDIVFIDKESDRFIISNRFLKMLNNKDFKQQVLELIEFGLERNKKYYNEKSDATNFVLYQKYTYEDVCKLCEWYKAEVALNIGGYKYNEKTKTLPVFINYNKDSNISDTIKYEDRFLSQDRFIALSKSNRTASSEDIKTIYSSKENSIDILLFVRKNKDDNESKEFYYLGKVNPIGEPIEIKRKKTNDSIVEITYELDQVIDRKLYDYLTK